MREDFVRIAFRTINQRKIRSFLTVLGIFLSILTIFVLLSLSLGLNDFVNEQFELLGTDKFFIQPKGSGGLPGAEGAVELSLEDVDVVQKVKGVEQATYFTLGNGKIAFKNYNPRYYYVMGMPTDKNSLKFIFESMGLEMGEGKFMKENEEKKIIMGYNYKYKNLFDKPVNVGNIVEINDIEFKVVGILEAIGNPGDDQQVYISFKDFKELYDSGERVDFIWVQTKASEDIRDVADRTEKKLMKSRDVTEKTIDFTVSTPEELLESFGSILNILTAFLVGIGAISLLVGGIGIANTMYTSVLERKKEIGTMKAVGARNSDILLIFVIEAGILGLIGGLLGLGFGILIAKLIQFIATIYLGSDMLRASINPFLILGCLIFAFFIGIISGFLPSYQASRLKPVDALRYE